MKTYKLGLFLAYKGYNYGAQLQAFATQWVLDSLGVSTEVIEYKGLKGDKSISFDLDYIFNILPKIILGKLKKKPINAVNDPQFIENKKLRDIERKRFVNERFHDIIKLTGYKALSDYAEKLDGVLIGSDQKWIPGFSFGKIDSLMFAPSSVRRISYSTSLGVSEYPKYCWRTARNCWKKIDFLSVREEQGANIIKEVCGDIPIQVLCDPTYVITKDQWLELIPFKKMREEKYVVCYILGNDDDIYKSARRFADSKNLKLITLLSCESYSPLATTFADEVILGASPEEFINWIRGSEYLLTDSFHGLAFSVINEKDFFIYYRKRDDAKLSRNSRIDNVLAKWGLEDRLITQKDCDWTREKFSNIEYQKVTPIVLKERQKALDFLKQALSFDENS